MGEVRKESYIVFFSDVGEGEERNLFMAMIFLFPALFCKEKDLRSGIRMEDTGRNTWHTSYNRWEK